MDTKDGFTISSFKMLLSVLSLVIMFPIVNNLTDNSFYVTVSVYTLGKFIDLIAKIPQRHLKVFFIFYILGVIFCIIAVAMCFFGFANISIDNGVTNTLAYNVILICVTTFICFVDVADFVFCICRLRYTKKKLNQFNWVSFLGK